MGVMNDESSTRISTKQFIGCYVQFTVMNGSKMFF